MFLPKTAVVASLVPWRKKKVPDRKWIRPSSLRRGASSAVEENAIKTESNGKNIGERSRTSGCLGPVGKKGGATLSPPQVTSRLASLADFFFRPRHFFFLSFPHGEPGPKLSSPFPLHPALQTYVVAGVVGF